MTFQAQARSNCRSGDAMLAGTGFGDDAALAHRPRQQRLTDSVVYLVGAGVVEVFTLEKDTGAAADFCQALGEIQR